MDSDLRRRLKAVADDLEGPLGRIPLDRALRKHIDLFEELRREGCSWPQLARALAVVGVKRADGEMIAADHLRGAVSRLMKVSASASTGRLSENTAPLRTAAPKEQAPSRSRTAKTTQPKPGIREITAVKPSGTQKPDRPTAVASSIQDKLSRVAKLRGG